MDITSYGAHGTITSELPIEKGSYLHHNEKDAPLSMKIDKYSLTFSDPHPILKNVTSFCGGNSSFLTEISKLSPKPDEIIQVVANWNKSDSEIPLIVTKQYSGAQKGSWGRIVILNFWPVSSRKDSDWFTSSTDGDLIMQNSVVWASPANKFELIKTILES